MPPEGDAQAIQRLENKVEMLKSMLRDAVEAKASADRALHNQQVKYEYLTRNVPWGVVVLRPDGHYADVNLYFAKVLGGKIEDIIDQPVGSLGEPESWTRFAQDRECLQTELALPSAQGQCHFLVLKFVNRVDGYISLMALDQTERAEALAEAQRQALRAEGASKAKSQFLAVMSHEIRTPMNGVLGMAALLEGTNLEEQQRHWVKIILDSGRNLVALINNVLDLSKIEAGGLELEKTPFSPMGVARDVVGLFSGKAAEAGVSLRLESETPTPEAVLGDPLRVQQIIINLVSNALKFTEAGSVRIRLSATSAELGLWQLDFAVTDTGPGIAPDKLTSLFEAFKQADASTTRQHGGTGLGLSIAQSLSQAMGGSLEVESEVGKGSTFRLRLALPETHATESEPIAPPPRVSSPMKVLVADDNAVNRLVVKGLLRRTGHEVHCVENGLEALKALQASPEFDLVLMDMEMPIMDGIESTRRIRDDSGPHRAVPIVALTANAMMDKRTLCLEAGMDDFLTKPIDPKALEGVLARFSPVGADNHL